jgi:predicted DNA-binding protein
MNLQTIIKSLTIFEPASKEEQIKYYINHKIDELEDVILAHGHDSELTRGIISKLEDVKLH